LWEPNAYQQKAREFVFGAQPQAYSPTRGWAPKTQYGVNGSPSLLERLQRHRENVPTEEVGREAEINMLERQLQEEQSRVMAEQAYSSQLEALSEGPLPKTATTNAASARVQALQERLRTVQGDEAPVQVEERPEASGSRGLLEWGERLKQQREAREQQ